MPFPTLLDELKDILKWHVSPEEGMNRWFNRQLHERVLHARGDGHRLAAPKAKWAHVRLDHRTVRVVEDSWLLERLTALKAFHHGDTPQKEDVAAVVVFQGWETTCLIDGQNRVNAWQKRGQGGPHRVLVVEPLLKVSAPFPPD